MDLDQLREAMMKVIGSDNGTINIIGGGGSNSHSGSSGYSGYVGMSGYSGVSINTSPGCIRHYTEKDMIEMFIAGYKAFQLIDEEIKPEIIDMAKKHMNNL